MLLVLGGALLACEKKTELELSIAGEHYRIPRGDVRAHGSVSSESPDVYVRADPPVCSFVLVNHPSNAIATNYAGQDTPLVSHINDVLGGEFELHSFPRA